jgi:hypothetical protein
MSRFFLEQGRGGFFKESMARMSRSFAFCENEACSPFVMAIGDWGLTNLSLEDQECELTMTGCTNQGFFDFSKNTYEAHRTGGGTRSRAFLRFVQGVVVEVPNDLGRMTDFQMSFRGEESTFTEDVPVSEGEPEWKTSPALGAWADSYGARSSRFLGR